LEPFVTIEIFGQPFTFRSDADASTAQAVADFLVNEVDRVETELSRTTPHVTRKAILVMTALNIASENFELKKSHLRLLQDLHQRSALLIRTLNNAVDAAAPQRNYRIPFPTGK
jgi:cell division protein ZapA (FtsZ GTPase activity inhibitor)